MMVVLSVQGMGKAPKPQGGWARFKRFIWRVRRNWIAATLISALIAVGTVVGAVKNLREGARDFVFPPPSALEVATKQSKQQISREFVTVAWKRLYRSRQFLARIGRNFSDHEIDEAWKALLESVEDMASRTMVFSIAFGDLYTNALRDDYEEVIQTGFNAVTSKIVDLRYKIKKKEIMEPELKCTLARLNVELDALNVKLYQFSACFDQKKRTATGCFDGGNASLSIRPYPEGCPAS